MGCTVMSVLESRCQPVCHQLATCPPLHLSTSPSPPQPPLLLSLDRSPSIEAAFCSRGSSGASGSCYSLHLLCISVRRCQGYYIKLREKKVVFMWSSEALLDLWWRLLRPRASQPSLTPDISEEFSTAPLPLSGYFSFLGHNQFVKHSGSTCSQSLPASRFRLLTGTVKASRRLSSTYGLYLPTVAVS